jgi:hypothetical protein
VPAEGGTAATRAAARLGFPGPKEPLMMRFVLAAALGFIAVTLAGTTVTTAQEKKKDEKKTLEGMLACPKCVLSEADKCGNALVVKMGDKKVVYYLVDKGAKEPYHKDCCTTEVPAKVTGKVTEKDGKKMIEDPKVEITKKK